MAEFFKRGRNWVFRYYDANGRRVFRTGCPDRRKTEEMATLAVASVARIRAGLADPKDEGYRLHEACPVSQHVAEWAKATTAKGTTAKHGKLFSDRASRIIAIVVGARLSEIEAKKPTKTLVAGARASLDKWLDLARLCDLTGDRVQAALATLKAEGRSLSTCNHHRAAIKAFSKWCHETHRTRDNALRSVKGYNAQEDRRHDRRTISLEELRRLIEATEKGPVVLGIAGPVRAIVYRLAVATGLRYSELATITPESFDWNAPSVTVEAAYTKNGQTATLPLSGDMASDLAAFVATLPKGQPIFPLPVDKGANLLRPDLAAAGIAYRDSSGLVFDFHALRCQMATLADAAGVSPRVVQKLMRHSTLELTGRYTRPRYHDIETAAASIPSLRPGGSETEAAAATGTDGPTHKTSLVTNARLQERGSVRFDAESGGEGVSPAFTPKLSNSLENKGFQGNVLITGEATRTPDLRIITPWSPKGMVRRPKSKWAIHLATNGLCSDFAIG